MRYIPHTKEDITHMLKKAGVQNIDELFACIPKNLQLNKPLQLPQSLDEENLCRHIESLALKNTGSSNNMAVFLGAGAYSHHIPAAVGQLLLRGEFFTAYTPYQPETSQGTLQAIFEYQSAMASLTGCEVVNASMYDGATATAEALLMALRNNKKRPRVLLSRSIHPEIQQVCQTYMSNHLPTLEIIPFTASGTTNLKALEQILDSNVAAVVVQQPNALGCLEDLPAIVQITKQAGALLITAVMEPVSLGILEAPGLVGSDIVTGEGMGLGSGLNFGGPGLGIFGTTKNNAWQMPGRLAGQTVDNRGQRAFVLTMSTREQHIRRARATSNICTNEGLCALAALIHLSLLGKNGFGELARINAANAQHACKLLCEIPGVSKAFSAGFFNEFALKLDKDPDLVMKKLKEAGIIGGLPLKHFYPELKDLLLVCVTEINFEEQVQRYCSVLKS